MKKKVKNSIIIITIVALLGLAFALLYFEQYFLEKKSVKETQEFSEGELAESKPGDVDEEDIEKLTLSVMKDGYDYKPEDDLNKKKLKEEKFKEKIGKRKKKMLELISENPKKARKYALPRRFIEHLSKEIPDSKILLEGYIDKEAGTLSVLHFDTLSKSIDRYYLSQKDSKKALHFPLEVPLNLVNNQVELSGIQLGENVLVDSIQVVSTQIVSNGKKKVAVIPVIFSDSSADRFSDRELRGYMFSNTRSINAYYKEATFGKIELVGLNNIDGDVLSLITFQSLHPCRYPISQDIHPNQDDIHWAMKEYIEQNIPGYDYYQLVLPPNHACGQSTGAAFIKEKVSFLYGLINTKNGGHELGHSLTLHHANSYECFENGVRVSISSQENCRSNEYQDLFEIMTHSNWPVRHVNTYHKGKLDSYDSSNMLTVTTDGKYNLFSIEQANNGVQLIRIPKEKDENGKISKYYYLEFRRPFGFDNFANSEPVVNGVSIRIASELNEVDKTNLVDTTPQTTTFNDAPLAMGKVFWDKQIGVSIITDSITSTNAVVSVSFGPFPCFRYSPTISINPSLQTSLAGESKNFQVNVRNNDYSGCQASDFEIKPILSQGWTQTLSPAVLSIAPGQSVSTTVVVSPPFGTPSGFYEVTENVVHTISPDLKASVSANYVIIPPDTNPPIIRITSPINNARITKKTAIRASASDASGISSIRILDGSRLLIHCTATTTCMSSASSLRKGQHTIMAIATDKNGNSATTSIKVTMK